MDKTPRARGVASSLSAVVPSARKNIFLPPSSPIRIVPAFRYTTPLYPASFSPFWSSRTNLYRARRCDGHANRLRRCVCVGARFGAGSILISIQSRTISSGSTFEERRVPLLTPRPRTLPPSPAAFQPSSLTPLFVLVARAGCPRTLRFFEYSSRPGLWEKLCKPW